MLKEKENSSSLLHRFRYYYPDYAAMLIFVVVHFLLYELSNHLATPERLHPVWCGVDEILGVQPWAIVPYVSWFFLLVFTCFYLVLTDTSRMRRFVKFCMITSALTVPVFFIWPTCVLHRPVIEGNDVFSVLLRLLYAVDNNANVMPSLHVIWAFAMLLAMWNDSYFRAPLWRLAWTAATLLITLSTMLTKQHSFLDSVFAVPYILVAWYFSFRGPDPAPLKPLFSFGRKGSH